MVTTRAALSNALRSSMKALTSAVFAVPILLYAIPGHASDLRISLAVGDDYPPWVDRALPGGGYAVALIREGARRAQHDFSLNWVPWRRAFETVKNGEAGITVPWIDTPDRRVDFLYSKPIIVQSDYIYTRKVDPEIRTASDMAGKRVCAPNGYTVYGDLETLIEDGQLERQTPPDMETCLRILEAGRVDFVVSVETEASAIIRQTRTENVFRQSPEPLMTFTFHAMVGKANPRAEDLITFLNWTIDTLEQDGTAARLKAEAETAAASKK